MLILSSKESYTSIQTTSYLKIDFQGERKPQPDLAILSSDLALWEIGARLVLRNFMILESERLARLAFELLVLAF
jgi:hypothetical protein